MLNAKEGQTYVCTKSDGPWWTKGKEYTVVTNNGKPCFIDDGGGKWVIQYWTYIGDYFKLKENTFDLNKLTTAQLKEYIDLLEDKEESESLLNDFIERMSK